VDAIRLPILPISSHLQLETCDLGPVAAIIAAVGLLVGGAGALWLGKGFARHKLTIVICFVIHAAYIVFGQMRRFWLALVSIGLPWGAVGVSSTPTSRNCRAKVSNVYRGRIFATMKVPTWTVWMIGAGSLPRRNPASFLLYRSVIENSVSCCRIGEP
jgi:hypothetical protein